MSAEPDPVAAFAGRLRAAEWRAFQTGDHSGAWNMGLDWALLEQAANGALPPTLRFYGWSPPALSLGRFQGLEGINLEALRRRGWDLVRRPTGGRAVLHHLELTYSLVLPPEVVDGAGVRTSYAVLSRLLNAGLRSLLPEPPPASPPEGATGRTREPNCFAFASECDSLVEGGKLVGSAQVRHRGALLQHGSILLDADRAAWEEILGSAGRLSTLRELLGSPPSATRVQRALEEAFQALGIRLARTGTPDLGEQAARIAARFALHPPS